MERRSAAETGKAPASAPTICDAVMIRATAITDDKKRNPVFIWSPPVNRNNGPIGVLGI